MRLTNVAARAPSRILTTPVRSICSDRNRSGEVASRYVQAHPGRTGRHDRSRQEHPRGSIHRYSYHKREVQSRNLARDLLVRAQGRRGLRRRAHTKHRCDSTGSYQRRLASETDTVSGTTSPLGMQPSLSLLTTRTCFMGRRTRRAIPPDRVMCSGSMRAATSSGSGFMIMSFLEN